MSCSLVPSGQGLQDIQCSPRFSPEHNPGGFMWTTILITILVCLILLLFGSIMALRKKPDDESVTFLCADCGEIECICHREDKKL